MNVDKLSDVIRSVQPTIISAAAYTASAEFIAEVTARIMDSCGRDAGPNAGKEGRGTFNLAPSGRVSWHGYAVELIREAKRHGWPLRIEENRIVPITSEQYRTAAARPKKFAARYAQIRQASGYSRLAGASEAIHRRTGRACKVRLRALKLAAAFS